MAELLKTRRPPRRPTGGLPPVLARGRERLAAAKSARPVAAKPKAVKPKARQEQQGQEQNKTRTRTKTRTKTKSKVVSRPKVKSAKRKAPGKGVRRGR